MKLKRCAMLTCKNLDSFHFTDASLKDSFDQQGWKVDFIPWDQKEIPWEEFEAVVVRATWDYFHRLDEFFQVMESIHVSGVPLLNPLETLRWNSRKTYLQDLESRGVRIIPTQICSFKSVDPLKLFETFQSDELVVKPLVSANADRTFRVKQSDFHQMMSGLKESFGNEVFIVQPFLKSVCQEGETSLFYFGGQYSHSVRKVPKAGDFRVQEEHGAVIKLAEPCDALRKAADQTILKLPVEHLYARLDFVLGGDLEWQLMEAELIEPSLYLEHDTRAAERFVRAFEARMSV